MKKIELTTEQRKKLIDALVDVHDENGAFDIDVEFDDIIVNATGHIELDGYCEDDYYDGTGAWIETYRSAWVELKAIVYTDDDETTCGVDASTEREVEDYLNAA